MIKNACSLLKINDYLYLWMNFFNFQKQPFADVLQNMCSQKFRKISSQENTCSRVCFLLAWGLQLY